jgi:hypothetical protein
MRTTRTARTTHTTLAVLWASAVCLVAWAGPHPGTPAHADPGAATYAAAGFGATAGDAATPR